MLSRNWIVNHQVDVTEEVVVKVAAVEAEAEEEGDGNKKSFTSKHLYYFRCYHTVLTSYLLALYYSTNLLCDASSALRIILHLLPAYSYIINII